MNARSPFDRLLGVAVERPANAYMLEGSASAVRSAAHRLSRVLIGRDPNGGPGPGSSNVAVFSPSGANTYLASQIDQIVIEAARAPLEGSRKTVVIEDAHQLGVVGESALLKTLEEPPASTSFILCVHDRMAVPDTIASRCVTLAVAGRSSPDRDAVQKVSSDRLCDETIASWRSVPARLRSDKPTVVAADVAVDLGAAARHLEVEQQSERDDLAEFVGKADGGRRDKASRVRKRATKQLEETQKRERRRSATRQVRHLFEVLVNEYGAVLRQSDDGEMGPDAIGTLRAIERLNSANEALGLHVNPELLVEDVFVDLAGFTR